MKSIKYNVINADQEVRRLPLYTHISGTVTKRFRGPVHPANIAVHYDSSSLRRSVSILPQWSALSAGAETFPEWICLQQLSIQSSRSRGWEAGQPKLRSGSEFPSFGASRDDFHRTISPWHKSWDEQPWSPGRPWIIGRAVRDGERQTCTRGSRFVQVKFYYYSVLYDVMEMDRQCYVRQSSYQNLKGR